MAAHALNRFDSHRRVVITGIGVIAPNGKDLQTFWHSVRNGISAAGPVTRFDTKFLPTRIAAEVRDFEADNYIDSRKVRRFDLSIQYGIAAARLAATDAQIDFSKMDSERIGVIEATSVSGMESSFKGQTAYESAGYRHMSPFTLLNAYAGGGSGEIALELGIRGHALTYSSSSASGNDVMGYALDIIQQDEADVMVVGGTEAPLLAPLWGAFCLVKVMTKRNDAPAQSMRPFEADQDGFLLGEGAAFFILEELSHALGRGAKIYAEVAGQGRSCEAFHSLSPSPDGRGMTRSMEKALRRARLHASEVNYINAHGTANGANDMAETAAINKVFGDYASRVAVSGTKPVTGHLLAASGALETAVCALSIFHQELPPTINFEKPAPGCNLDYIPNKSRPFPVRVAMNLNCGFGGKNACLILKAFPE